MVTKNVIRAEREVQNTDSEKEFLFYYSSEKLFFL